MCHMSCVNGPSLAFFKVYFPQWFCLVPVTNLDRFWGKKVPTEGNFFCLELEQKQKMFWNTHYLITTIGGVLGGQFNLNSTFFLNLILKTLKKKVLDFFSKLDTLHSIVLPMGVSLSNPAQKSTFLKSFIPIGWCEFTPALQNTKLRRHE